MKVRKLFSNVHIFSWLLILFLAMSLTAVAQETVVVGQVLSMTDKSPIVGANVYFKNSTEVTQTNEEGFFMIRTTKNHNTLIVSSVGFKQKQIRLKAKQVSGFNVQLEEENTLLQEVFVIPGANPAMDLMKKIHRLSKQNDVTRRTGFSAQSTEQNLVLLSKTNQRLVSKRVFDQLKIGNISKSDSTLVIPLYMTENKYSVTRNGKSEIAKNVFSSPEEGEKILEKLVGDLATELNFYNATVTIFGKNLVSPLAGVGNLYYNYYLADSLQTPNGKQYEIHFRSKNVKNLAFNGKFWVDSASLALTRVEAELPNQANINFIHNLRVAQNFALQPNKNWVRQSEELALNMHYALMTNKLQSNSELFIKRSATYNYTDSITLPTGNFAQSDYSQQLLNDKLTDLNNTPVWRTAKWIADVMFTGYMNMGKIDLGRIQQILRKTDIEGYRLTLPFRTNENLWKNVSLGGYVGYGFKNQEVKYSGVAQFRLPGEKRRIVGVNYTNDYRQIDYNYNDFIYRENPLVTSDADISSTVFADRSEGKINERKELSLSFTNDWNSDIESSFTLRSHKIFAANWFPVMYNQRSLDFLQTQSATLLTRFSNNEKIYDDHLQRIYIANNKPVFYTMLEAGKYKLDTKTGQYGKITAAVKQNMALGFGQFRYVAEAGCVLGDVPYPLLGGPAGSESGGYGLYQFSLLRYMEYSADKYINLQTEFTMNGLILNKIPIVKLLNLRELCSFKLAYGSLTKGNKELNNYWGMLQAFDVPYMEGGIGVTNILHILSVQWVCQLTDRSKPIVTRSGIKLALSLSF